jgi:hypothetical protein
MSDEPRRKTRYRGERCSSKLTLNRNQVMCGHWTQGPDNAPSASVYFVMLLF